MSSLKEVKQDEFNKVLEWCQTKPHGTDRITATMTWHYPKGSVTEYLNQQNRILLYRETFTTNSCFFIDKFLCDSLKRWF